MDYLEEDPFALIDSQDEAADFAIGLYYGIQAQNGYGPSMVMFMAGEIWRRDPEMFKEIMTVVVAGADDLKKLPSVAKNIAGMA